MKTINHPLSISIALSLLVCLWSVEAQSPLSPDAQTRALYHFNEPDGTNEIIDSSFSGAWGGTLLNGAGRGASLFSSGTALALDGVDDYASVNGDVLNNLPQGTVEAFIYVESYDKFGGSPVVSKGTTALTDFLLNVDSDGRLTCHMGGGPSIASSSVIPTQTWVKVAATWDGVVRRLYINNTLNSEQASASTPLISANIMKIGRHEHDQGPFFFPGLIDDVRISEVARVFQPDSDGDGIPDAQDLYPGTPPGSIVNSDGGSIDQIVPCAGPVAGGIWKNHGQYVASVAKVAEQFLKAGLITDDQKDAIVSNAAESSCGKKL